MNDQNRKSDELTFWQKLEIIRAVSMYPALTLMVFTRRKIGFRILKINGIVIMGLIMLFVASLVSSNSDTSGAPLTVFALAMIGMAIFQRTMRWRDLTQGVRWHTYCVGISYLEMVPWPPVIASHRRVYRYIEPVACFLVGMLISWIISRPLGIWIMFSSLALSVFEQTLFEKHLERDLDILDGLISAEVQGETAKFFDGPQPGEKQRTLEDTAGIPTGVAPDIHRQVEIRRAKLAKAPDNLATETPDAVV